MMIRPLNAYIDTDKLHKKKANDPETQNVRNILAGSKVKRLSTNRQVLNNMNHVFSHKVDKWSVTDQHHTGRCWIHASLNVLKTRWMHKYPHLELSPCYISFFDKLERANTVLQHARRTKTLSIDEREITTMLTDVGTDGGQWNMFVQLVEKYGVVPKWSMDDTLSDKDSNDVNNIISDIVVTAVFKIREVSNQNEDSVIKKCLEDIYHVLYVHFGEPPDIVNMRWNESASSENENNTSNQVVDKGWIRPMDLFRSICPVSLDTQYIMLCNDPRHEYAKVYTVDGVTSTVDGDTLTYLNVSIDTMMKYVFRSIVSHQQPVWFTCDVGQQFHRGLGVMDSNVYMPERLYRLEKASTEMSKRERLQCRKSMPTHAMVFTGVDVAKDPDGNSQVAKWRVENSWGKGSKGDAKGFIAMSNSWFHDFVYQVVIDVRIMEPHLVEYVRTVDPIRLPQWDVFGTVAK